MKETCKCGCRHGVTADSAAAKPASVGPEETVEDTVRQSQRAAEILRGFGIDTCCGGRLTLGQAAAAAGVPVAAVLAALGTGREAVV
jgi:uncharacterized protein DUF542